MRTLKLFTILILSTFIGNAFAAPCPPSMDAGSYEKCSYADNMPGTGLAVGTDSSNLTTIDTRNTCCRYACDAAKNAVFATNTCVCKDGFHKSGNTCAPNSYTIRFDTADGLPYSIDSISCTYGTPCTFPEPPTRQGYIFGGWKRGPELYQGAAMPAEFISTPDHLGMITLEAYWTTCPNGQHMENNTCVSNTRACSPLPTGTHAGTQTWGGTSWGACVATSCKKDYYFESAKCTVCPAKTTGPSTDGHTMNLKQTCTQYTKDTEFCDSTGNRCFKLSNATNIKTLKLPW